MEIQSLHIKQLKQGDAKIQKWVFEGLYNKMFNVSLRYVSRMDEAEDCVMKGFLKAFQQIDSFQFEHNLSFYNWLKRIVVNESLMALRKQNNLSLAAIDEATEVTHESDILHQIEAKYLLEAITKLPVGYRTVFNLFVVEGYSHKEIAMQLGISENTSKTQLAKAKQKLQIIITQKQYGYGNG
ncbi:MAG: RNA polymerase sigma factor [Bacteroidota bacterium]